jgi:2,6-dihydroxypseudooxynicotine hydrolase
MELVYEQSEKDWRESRFLSNRSRILANGVDVYDLESTMERIRDWGDWCREWCKTAQAHEERAEKALAFGFNLTAAQFYLRAASCYHFAQNLFYEDLEQKIAAQRRKVECFAKGAPALKPSPARVEIPFEKITLAAYLRVPETSDKFPCVILIPGSDASKEEFYPREEYFLRRGIATLSLDGPGQGETWFKMRMRVDYQSAVSAAIDWLTGQPRIDAGKIGLWGGSFAGYLVVRAAAFDQRVAACVENCGPFDISYYRWDDTLRLRRFNYLWGTESAEEATEIARQVTLRGVIENVQCPLLIIHGKADPVTLYHEANKMYEAAKSPKEIWLFDEANHLCHNVHHIVRPMTADWLRQKLVGAGL